MGCVSNRLRISVAITLAACGLATFTFRGYAEPPATETPQAPSATDASAARIARASQPKFNPDPIAGLFQRESVSPADISENKTGIVEARIGEMLGHKEFAPLLTAANRGLGEELKTYLEIDEAPVVDLQSIEVLYGGTQVAVRPSDKKGESQLLFGFGVPPTHIRFTEQVDAESWVKKHIASAVQRQLAGTDYAEIPEVQIFGPRPVLVANRDPRTFCIGTSFRVFADNELDIDRRSKVFVDSVNRSRQPNHSVWAKSFDQVKGGLCILVFTKEVIRIPDKFDPSEGHSAEEIETGRIFHHLQHTFETVALGVDMNAEGTKLGFRIHLSAADDAQLEILLADVRKLMQLGVDHMESPVDEENPEIEDPQQRDLVRGIYQQIFDRMVIEKATDEDGASYVAIRSPIEYPSLANLIADYIVGPPPRRVFGNRWFCHLRS